MVARGVVIFCGVIPLVRAASRCWFDAVSFNQCCISHAFTRSINQHVECWSEHFTFEDCCLSADVLSDADIKAWESQDSLDCGCNNDNAANPFWCGLRDILNPVMHVSEYYPHQAFVFEFQNLVWRFADSWVEFTVSEMAACPMGTFTVMLMELVNRPTHGLSMTDAPSLRFVNQAFPYLLRALPQVVEAGWNPFLAWNVFRINLKLTLKHTWTSPLTNSELGFPSSAGDEMNLYASIADAIDSRNKTALMDIAASYVGWPWSLQRSSLGEARCFQGSREVCCAIPAMLAFAGWSHGNDHARLDMAVSYLKAYTRGQWLPFFLTSPWPILQVLEVGAPWPVLHALDIGSTILTPPKPCHTSSVELDSEGSSNDKDCAESRYVALVLRGATFQTRLVDETTIGHVASVPDQLRAATSHMRYIVDPLEASGYRVHIFGATYPSPFLDSLSEFYGRHMQTNFTVVPLPGSQKETFAKALEAMMQHDATFGICYRAAFISRFDLILKQSVPALVPSLHVSNKVMAPFWCEVVAGAPYADQVSGSLCASDVLQYVPRKWLRLFHSIIAENTHTHHIHYHDILHSFLYHGVDPSFVGVMLPDRYFTNPVAQWNPLYSFANRYGPQKPFDCISKVEEQSVVPDQVAVA
eukprot:TRINITY_DN72869_c0_g1_i1.p1 TRINITY_DN72869_c0_g1~~TRINITY_DN72869_c0_g1_i1.p1  ORF type:complete len:641 (+),score=48.68 TRINITY_DN72869_c0_g1_i1:168-2090(+)